MAPALAAARSQFAIASSYQRSRPSSRFAVIVRCHAGESSLSGGRQKSFVERSEASTPPGPFISDAFVPGGFPHLSEVVEKLKAERQGSRGTSVDDPWVQADATAHSAEDAATRAAEDVPEVDPEDYVVEWGGPSGEGGASGAPDSRAAGEQGGGDRPAAKGLACHIHIMHDTPSL